MTGRRFALIAVVLAGLLLAVGGKAWLGSGFEPGGGGADQPPPIVEASGSVRIPLKLTVWGGGGPITGRYTQVALLYRADATAPFRRLSAPATPLGPTAELYEFRLSRSADGVSGAIDYHFEVTLDGVTSTIERKQTVMLP